METSGNQRQLAGTQVGLVRSCKRVDDSLIDKCANARQALSLCIRLSGFTDEKVAEGIGISKGYLSKVLSGRASLKSELRIRVMQVCGNVAPAQYESRAVGFDLMERKRDQMIAELRAQLEKLEAA